MGFEVRVALVTGAASGMGRIVARRLASGGAAVASLDLNAEGLESASADSPNLHPFPCDVGDPDAVAAVVAEVEERLGPIDRTVHAAAIMPCAPLAEMELATIHRLMRVNYEGTVNVVLTTLRRMLPRRRGQIVMFGSLAGTVLVPEMGAYSASKAAVQAFADVLIHENIGSGVQILLAAPPMTETPLLDQASATSNPKSLQIGREQGFVADPYEVVDEIERALARGQRLVYPGVSTKVLALLRRLAPELMWKLVLRAERR